MKIVIALVVVVITITNNNGISAFYSFTSLFFLPRLLSFSFSLLLLFFLQAHEELWLDCAQKLTSVIQQIIEFAKAVPGFRKFSQDDQIVLLKSGESRDLQNVLPR